MFVNYVSRIFDEQIDWFFDQILKDHYESRRDILREATHLDENVRLSTAIDYILSTNIGPGVEYPPESSHQWKKHLAKLSNPMKKLLVIYLKLDIENYLSLKQTSKEKLTEREIFLKEKFDKFYQVPKNFDFAKSIVHVGTGLWALDNGNTKLSMVELTNCLIKLDKLFNNPKDIVRIIVDGFTINNHPREALFLSKAFDYQPQNDDYDTTHVSLLIITQQYAEALRYQRMFKDREKYEAYLEHFLDTCRLHDALKQVSCLFLSVAEEAMLNEISQKAPSIASSRPVTPSCSQTPSIPKEKTKQNANNAGSNSMKTQSSSKQKNPRHIQLQDRIPSLNDSPAKNTRQARRKKKGN